MPHPYLALGNKGSSGGGGGVFVCVCEGVEKCTLGGSQHSRCGDMERGIN